MLWGTGHAPVFLIKIIADAAAQGGDGKQPQATVFKLHNLILLYGLPASAGAPKIHFLRTGLNAPLRGIVILDENDLAWLCVLILNKKVLAKFPAFDRPFSAMFKNFLGTADTYCQRLR